MGKVCATVILILISIQAFAATVANYRGVYPVDEVDIREVILGKLKAIEKSGELAQRKKEVIESVSNHILRPAPINLPTTSTPETFTVSPEVIVNEDIITPQGQLIAAKGTKINPFKQIAYKKALFFFNADDSRQVKWVQEHYKSYYHVKFILTGGNVREANRLFGRVYFDLKGVLAKRFELRHVPSVVTQSELKWKIEEGAIL